ncbi:YdcF family protein [Paenibacillus filicis]|uniref:YdcF family protein n=1 Tax=Paenibacillus gyeongsangnamensis TaxID=3388067 RepID=A0ABT4QHP7_9BACL|nr:YdcF family protein [Paenibacillus filicis]MCZ8516394.1 YdcF family protein [Paenibacillus filicis]
MIYVLKGVYSFLVPPGLFVIAFALLGVRLWQCGRRRAEAAVGMITLLLYVVSTPLAGEAAVRSLEARYEPPAAPVGDVYLVLGGGAVGGVPEVEGSGQLTGTTLSRVVTAAELYHRKRLPILVSGGQVYDDSGNEARLSKRKLLALGVPEQDILIEDRSRTTQENAAYSRKFLEEKGLRSPILITSASHMARSVKHFHKQGIEVTPYPTGYLVSPSAAWSWSKMLPSSGAMDAVALACKEYLGLLQ